MVPALKSKGNGEEEVVVTIVKKLSRGAKSNKMKLMDPEKSVRGMTRITREGPRREKK